MGPRTPSPAAVQAALLDAAEREARVPGFRYRADFLTAAEEQDLLAWIERDVRFGEVRMRGQVARRTVASFGWRYAFGSGRVAPGVPLPPPLLALRERAAAAADVEPARLEQALVSRYPPGAAIGWHRDAPAFGDTVIGVSLRSPATLRLRPAGAGERASVAVDLAPRSLYVIAGPARARFEHALSPVRATRYVVTMRTLAERARRERAPAA